MSKHDWKALLDRAVLMFSDQQLITGLAIQISGYSQLSPTSESISANDWQLMVYTTWFASLTHLTTLTSRRQYFRELSKARLWRVVLMTLLMSLLVVALLPTGNVAWLEFVSNWNTTAGIPARCFFQAIGRRDSYDTNNGNENGKFLSMLVSMIVLCVGHFTRVIRVSKQASRHSQSWLKDFPLNRLEGAVQQSFERTNGTGHTYYYSLKYLSLSVVFILLLATLDFFSSLVWEASAEAPNGMQLFANLYVDFMASVCPDLGHSTFDGHPGRPNRSCLD